MANLVDANIVGGAVTGSFSNNGGASAITGTVIVTSGNVTGTLTASIAAPLNSDLSVKVNSVEYPTSSIPVASSAFTTSNAALSASFTGNATQSVFIEGFSVTTGGATAAALFSATLANIKSGAATSTTMSWVVSVTTGSTIGSPQLNVNFN